VSGNTAVTSQVKLAVRQLTARDTAAWLSSYLRTVIATDGACAFGAAIAAIVARPWSWGPHHVPYLIFTATLPLLWWAAVALAGGYDSRYIGVGSSEFRRVLVAGVSVIAAIAFVSYATKEPFARGYVVVALPTATLFALVTRYALRKRLHRRRRYGACLRRVVAVGYAASVMDLIIELRRETSHGLSIVGACLAEGPVLSEIAGVRCTAASPGSPPRSPRPKPMPWRCWHAPSSAGAGCASSPGTWRRRAPTCACSRRCWTSGWAAPPSARWPGCP
jgi:hypothetical protein